MKAFEHLCASVAFSEQRVKSSGAILSKINGTCADEDAVALDRRKLPSN
jgi:hypothetical protein